MCYYSRGQHPYFTLHPMAVEELHPEPHSVLVYHHLLTSLQADLLTSIAEPYMRKAAVGKVFFRRDSRATAIIRISQQILLLLFPTFWISQFQC
jgi:hypothetical protein